LQWLKFFNFLFISIHFLNFFLVSWPLMLISYWRQVPKISWININLMCTQTHLFFTPSQVVQALGQPGNFGCASLAYHQTTISISLPTPHSRHLFWLIQQLKINWFLYVDGNIRNLALPVMPRQYQKFIH